MSDNATDVLRCVIEQAVEAARPQGAQRERSNRRLLLADEGADLAPIKARS